MQLLARTCKTDRMMVERLGARVFVVAGGLFWVAAALGAFTGYLPDEDILIEALILLILTAVVFVVGLFYEYLAALIALVIAIGAVVYGFAAPGIDEAGTWALWLLFTTAPAAMAALLYFAAARMQGICELQQPDS
jgi:hypothetical protein